MFDVGLAGYREILTNMISMSQAHPQINRVHQHNRNDQIRCKHRAFHISHEIAEVIQTMKQNGNPDRQLIQNKQGKHKPDKQRVYNLNNRIFYRLSAKQLQRMGDSEQDARYPYCCLHSLRKQHPKHKAAEKGFFNEANNEDLHDEHQDQIRNRGRVKAFIANNYNSYNQN